MSERERDVNRRARTEEDGVGETPVPTGAGGDAAGLEIVAREDFSEVAFSLEIRHPMMARAAKPG